MNEEEKINDFVSTQAQVNNEFISKGTKDIEIGNKTVKNVGGSGSQRCHRKNMKQNHLLHQSILPD